LPYFFILFLRSLLLPRTLRIAMDDEIDEMEQRVEELERLIFAPQDDDATPEPQPLPQQPAWDALSELEVKVRALENVLNPDENLLSVGEQCLAFSIADGAWMEAVIEARPAWGGNNGNATSTSSIDSSSAASSQQQAGAAPLAPSPSLRTYSVRFAKSGQKRSVVADQLKPNKVDLESVRRLEKSVAQLARERLPLSDDLAGLPWPLAVPLTREAQRALIFDAEPELVRSAQCMDAIFKDPLNLGAALDSKALNEMPGQCLPLLRLEKQVALDMHRAATLSADTRKLLDLYGEVVVRLNEKMVAWEDALSG